MMYRKIVFTCGMAPAIGLLLLVALPGAAQPRYFRAEGKDIVNPAGNPVVLRGLGLGGWLMPEGYMLHVPGFGSPTTIRKKIEDLIGPDDTDRFFERYEAHYVAEQDVAAIAAWGFDHVRLPFHYKVLYDPDAGAFREEGFALFDRFLGWCKTYGLYVILDMHAAPGGQNDGNISDSDGTARLWTEPDPYQDLTVEIWTEIARRYADEPQILGYDLINEPVLPDGIPPQDLVDLYERLAAAIRAIDPYHILFIEGNWFATDFSMFSEPLDYNMVYAFHKYWNSTSRGTIQYLLDLRDRQNVPLWLGESGENSNTWFYEVTRMVEAEGIGWNWWTHKKIETVTSPLSASFTDGYRRVLNYWNGQALRPSAAEARDALFGMAEALALDSCTHRPDVVRALLDDDFATAREPYARHTIPGVLYAVDFDFGNQGVAYSDLDYKNESGAPGIANNGGRYRNDGVDIEPSTDPEGFAYNVGWITAREWILYTVEVLTAGVYDVDVRVASAVGGGRFDLSLDDAPLAEGVSVASTNGWQNWRTITLTDVPLPAGVHTLKLSAAPGGFNVNFMRFTLVEATGVEEADPRPDGARLLDPYPNPFHDTTTIRFETQRVVEARLAVYDVLGRVVLDTGGKTFPAGHHTLPLRPDGLAAGTYVLRLTVDDGLREQHFARPIIYTP